MLETITAGLLLAAVSAITYLAYKHPRAYSKIYWPLSALNLIILIVIAGYMFGVQRAVPNSLRSLRLQNSPNWKNR